jgi:hypothetical protein
VWVQVYFYTHDSNLNPTCAKPGLSAGFVFHPRVHPKSEKKPKTQKKPEKTKKNSKLERNLKKPRKKQKIMKKPIYKIRQAIEPDGFRFGCQISPTDSGLNIKFNQTIFFYRSDPLPSLPVSVTASNPARRYCAPLIRATWGV